MPTREDLDPVSSLEAAPVLEADGARVVVDDVIAIDRLSLVSRGDRVLFVGDTRPLFAALTGAPLGPASGALHPLAHGPLDDPPGEARLAGGDLRVAGRTVGRSAYLAVRGAAPLDPPLPPRWTSREYVAWSARLAGVGPRASRELAASALDRVGLGSASGRRLDALALPERRALQLAQAIVVNPAVLVADSPLAGLDGAAAGFVLAALAAATEGRAAILSAERLGAASPEGSLVLAATDVFVLARGEILLEGAGADFASGAQVYAVTVGSRADHLRLELDRRGIEVRGGPLHLSVWLSPGAGTAPILEAAHAARAPLLGLAPLA